VFVVQIDVMKKMKEICGILRVPHNREEDVQFMLEQLLEGEWGQGRWICILIGACIYIAIRQSHLPLTLMEVAVSFLATPVRFPVLPYILHHNYRVFMVLDLNKQKMSLPL